MLIGKGAGREQRSGLKERNSRPTRETSTMNVSCPVSHPRMRQDLWDGDCSFCAAKVAAVHISCCAPSYIHKGGELPPHQLGNVVYERRESTVPCAVRTYTRPAETDHFDVETDKLFNFEVLGSYGASSQRNLSRENP